MKRQLAILGSDQVNRAESRIPASALMDAEEKSRVHRLAHGLPPGVPSHIQHYLHRPIGWCKTLGHLVDGAMVRVIGLLEHVEADEEKAALKALTDKYWQIHHDEGMESVKLELEQLVQPHTLGDAKFLRIEAYVVSQPGLAASLYPEFFSGESGGVDKDGLTYYRSLIARMKPLHPGVFLDEQRGLVIFAHRFFRRSLSHRNKLNEYFLQSFDTAAADFPDVAPRLRLDPDLVGHPETVKYVIELEHWHGPKFSDDIESIPAGATEHKADQRVRDFEGVDKTHFWWKEPETRKDDQGKELVYRTFEAEELIENPSGGLLDDRFGCRYTHAEFSPDIAAITHFDGAIRAYPAETYLERIERKIDRAGKHSEYTKVFRFDGPLPVDRWKRLMGDYFRGNPLISEYLGALVEEAASAAAEPEQSPMDEEGEQLCAFISIEEESPSGSFSLERSGAALPGGIRMSTVETGCENVDRFLRTYTDFSGIVALGSTDGSLNLSRMVFGASEAIPDRMREVVAGVAEALAQDIALLDLSNASVALSWPFSDGLMVTLSLRGGAKELLAALRRLFSVVDPTKKPSEWIEPLSTLVKELAPRRTPVADLWDVTSGRLSFQHSEEEPYRMLLPDEMMQMLLARRNSRPSGPHSGVKN